MEDGLYHYADGSMEFPDGTPVMGANFMAQRSSPKAHQNKAHLKVDGVKDLETMSEKNSIAKDHEEHSKEIKLAKK